MLTKEKLIELIDEHQLSDYKDLILEHSKPAIYIQREYVPDEDDLPIGASKIGGNPDLPADFEWRYYNELPLTFLAQIKLSDVAPYDVDHVLPKAGWLYFFYEVEQEPWGSPDQADGFLTFYVEDVKSHLERITHPTLRIQKTSSFIRNYDYWIEVQALPPFKLIFSEMITVSNSDEIWDMLATTKPLWENPTAEKYEQLVNRIEEKYSPLHYLLGNPLEIQREPALEAQFGANGYVLGSNIAEEDYEILKSGISDWQLLFQMESDHDDNVNLDLKFGDLGNIYFMIREQDLKAKRFDKVWQIMQCS